MAQHLLVLGDKMKKFLGGVSLTIAVVLAVLLNDILAQASVGDGVYCAKESEPQLLTGGGGGQKQMIAQFARALFPQIILTEVDEFKCHQDILSTPGVWVCRAVDERVLTDEEYLDADLAGSWHDRVDRHPAGARDPSPQRGEVEG